MVKRNNKIKNFKLAKEIDNFFNEIFESKRKDQNLIKPSISNKLINKKRIIKIN